MSCEADQVAEYADRVLGLNTVTLTDDYYHQSLPLCVIDAVYSIGVRYEGVRRVVARYCDRTEQRRVRPDHRLLSPPAEQEAISTFCERFEHIGTESMTTEYFGSRQRTSTRSGILKSEAVYRFASALRTHGVEYLQDIPAAAWAASLEPEIRSIPGQTSGISLQYFWMLSGSDDFVKPDRMVLRFLEAALERAVSVAEAQGLLGNATIRLSPKYPNLTPRLLDYAVWQHQRQQGK